MTDILIVIPVRRGSNGIPHKALRPLNGVSPLLRTIATAKQVGRVVVTTDDADVLRIARQDGVEAVLQPPEVSHPDVSLDAPVAWATDWAGYTDGIVVTMQCTSPFTTVTTLRTAIAHAEECDTCVTVRDDRGLRWHTTPGLHLSGLAPTRVVRQAMAPEYRETGAILATKRRFVTPVYRFGHTVYLLEVFGAEAVDLDTMEDWWIAERYAEQQQQEVAA